MCQVAQIIAVLAPWVRWRRGAHRLVSSLPPLLAHGAVIAIELFVIHFAATRVMEDIAVRAQPVAEAVVRFRAERGAPPPNLAALVPEYLPQLPAPRLAYELELQYTCELSNDRCWLESATLFRGAGLTFEDAPFAEQRPIRRLRHVQSRHGYWVFTAGL